MKHNALALAIVAAMAAGAAQAQGARDTISIVGSSTVYPFTTTVAETFGKGSGFKTPKVESTGTGGGMKLFCAGVGVQHPDITNASRRIKPSELDDCRKNGVADIIEIKVGYDGIVVANSKKAPTYQLTRKDLWLALAKEVPDPKGGDKLVANPYKSWKEIDPVLPDNKIEVLGPPPTSGTRDSFVELVLDVGCRDFPAMKALEAADAKRHKAACQTMREDGAFIEAGENDNLIVQKLEANPGALGIFGYSFLEENLDKVHGSVVDGHSPTFEEVADGKYPIARELFIYVKKAHIGVIPGINEFIAEYTSEKAMGKDGYLADKGLIPLPDAMLKAVQADVKAGKVLTGL